MNWATLAMSSALVFAFVAVLDKYLLAHSLPNVRIFYLVVGTLQILMGLIILILSPWTSNPSIFTLFIAISSGLIWGAGLMLMFYGISKLEVSRVIPIAHTYPVFVAIMAVAFLGERLSIPQCFGVIITVCGAALTPMKPNHQTSEGVNSKLYLLVLLGSVFTATANVTYKYALEDMAFWDITAIRSFSLGTILICGGCNISTIRDLKDLISYSWASLSMLVFVEGILAPVGMLMMLQSLALGPVSLASTLMSIRPFFVLIISGVLSTKYIGILNEPIDRETLPVKLLSTTMIFVGICLLMLY